MPNFFGFDIEKIYTLIHKTEKSDFYYSNSARLWDGFVLVTDGEMTFSSSEVKAQTVKKGGIVFLYKNEKYCFKSKKGCAYFTSAFDLKDMDNEALRFLPKISYCTPIQIKKAEELTEIWHKKLDYSFMFCKIELLRLYLEFIKGNSENCPYNGDSAVNWAIRFIHENFKRNFKTSEIARACSLSESHLRLKFIKETGKTITEYRDSLRLKVAKELLSSGFFTVKEAAFELGFCDVYYFTKFFSALSGTTPAKYIKENSVKK